MTGHTAKWQLPYPEPADYVSDSQATMQELAEKIDTALSAVTPSDSYTVPGTLLADMTTSGTFTPPAGVTLVHVVVIGGGGAGHRGLAPPGYYFGGGGGGGGQVIVLRDLPVSGPVTVAIGGSATATTFAGFTAGTAFPAAVNGPGVSLNANAAGCGGRSGASQGRDGVKVNGIHYAGGGGYGDTASGGAGGGGQGGNAASPPGQNGTAGTGGGGGGGGYNSNPGVGGSGRVLVFTEQPTMRRSGVPVPDPDPLIVAALDDHGVMTGAYAVDAATRELPDKGVRVIDYPTAPVDTGRTVTAPADPADPDGPTVEVPVLAWPVAGWNYTDTDGWKEPHE